MSITNILGSIDKKIEINKKKIEKLEAIARDIYDYWFVQYEFPDENGKPYKSNGGQLIWNEELKREIPIGWKKGNIGLYCELVRGVSYERDEVKESFCNSSVMLIKSNNIDSPHINFDDAIFVPQKNVATNQCLKNGNIIITMSSGSKNHMGKMGLFYHTIPCTFGAFCAKISVINIDYYEYIVNSLFSERFKSHLNTQTSGTSINNISNDHILSYSIELPESNIVKKFHSIVGKYYEEICTLFLQNASLKSQKMMILPLLMNGQAKVF